MPYTALEDLPSVLFGRHHLSGTEATSRGFQLETSVEVDSDAVLATPVDSIGEIARATRPLSKWPTGAHHSEAIPAVGGFDVFREIQQAVIQKATEKEIDQVVCESLVESGSYAVASVCTVTLPAGDIHPRAVAGSSIEVVAGESPASNADVGVFGDATFAAASSGETHIVHVESDSDQSEALLEFLCEEEEHWLLATPILFEGVRYGVLTVCAPREYGYDDYEQTLIEELALTVGHALNAARWKQMFVGERSIELDVSLPGPLDFLGPSVGQGGSDLAVTVEEMIPVDTSRVIQYLTVTGNSPADFREAMAETEEVASVRQLDTDGDGSRFQVVYDDFPLVSTLGSYGGRIETLRFDVPDLHATVVLPLTVDVRQLVEALRAEVSDLKISAQRTVDRSQTPTAPYEGGFEDLTACQRKAILTAFVEGYFEWPRVSTAEEVAATLDISSPTFHYHLRLAQQKMLSRILKRNRLTGE